MANKKRAQSTRFESLLVTMFRGAGFTSRRLAEGGRHDEGDVEVIAGSRRWVVEVKAAERLKGGIHGVLAHATGKADDPAVVIWKRLVRKDGNTRRSSSGEPVTVSMTLAEFVRLLTLVQDATDTQHQFD